MDYKNAINPQSGYSADRLCDAADRVLSALHPEQGRTSAVEVWTGPVSSAPASAFTIEEYIEATLLLVRLGIIESRELSK